LLQFDCRNFTLGFWLGSCITLHYP
jgi:hypothetical protein